MDLMSRRNTSSRAVAAPEKAVADARIPAHERASQLRLRAALLIVVASTVACAHWPALSANAISFDDNQYLTKNRLVQTPSWASASRFLGEVRTPSTVNGYYQPLTMISLMLDSAFGGRPDNLRPYHRTSLALHVINTILVIVLLEILFGNLWIAAMVGLLFGVHPLTVETIPWIGERKTLLAALFALVSLIAYVRYVHFGFRIANCGLKERKSKSNPQSAIRNPQSLWFAASVLGYVLALLSKPTSTPIPVLMLLLDYWPLRRLSLRAVVEKLPFFAIGLVSAVITFVSQRSSAGVFYPGEQSPLRIPLTLCHNIVFYPWKMVWPANLSSHYPFPEPMALSQPMVLAGVIGTCILFSLLLISLRWTRAPVTGWLIFFVAIFPTMGVIGFTNVIASDKYAYLPSVGILIVLAWAMVWLWRNRLKALPIPATMFAIVLILTAAEARATRRYLGAWQNTEKLYQHMIALAPNAWALHYNVGNEYADRGRHDDAIGEFEKTLELKPDYAEARYNIGNMLTEKGRTDDAIASYRQAIGMKPDFANAHTNLGLALTRQGKIDNAIAEYRRALELAPNSAEARNNLGNLLAQRGQTDEALNQYRDAVRLNPDNAEANYNLGNALSAHGKADEAVAAYRRALVLKPDYVDAHNNLGLALGALGRIDEAITHYRQALQIQPDSVVAHYNMGLVLAARGRIDEAVDHLRRALQLKPDLVEAHINMGALLQRQGRIDESIAVYRRALRIDPKNETARRLLEAASTQAAK